MNKQRVGLLIASGTGMTATSLPWLTSPVGETMNGTMSLGNLTLIFFAISIGTKFYRRQNKTLNQGR